MTNDCIDCQRFRRHIEMLRDRNAVLELRLEGARQRERLAAVSIQPDLQEPGCDIADTGINTESILAGSAAVPVKEGEEDNHA